MKRASSSAPESESASALPVVKVVAGSADADPAVQSANSSLPLPQLLTPTLLRSAIENSTALVRHGWNEGAGELLDAHFSGGHLDTLVRETASDAVHVWMRGPDGHVRSIQTDPESALHCHTVGHSLYFRSSAEAAIELVSAAIGHLGWPLEAACDPSNDSHPTRGEVEVFCSRVGHTTPWHWDFMENFTVQLRGSKRWRLRRGPVQSPLRGFTPHYRNPLGVAEQQAVTRRFTDGCSGEDGGDEAVVELQPGSVMYFPAGMWHQVECTADSLSINVSIFAHTVGDVVSDALRRLMLQNTAFRRPVQSPEQLTAGVHTLVDALMRGDSQDSSLTMGSVNGGGGGLGSAMLPPFVRDKPHRRLEGSLSLLDVARQAATPSDLPATWLELVRGEQGNGDQWGRSRNPLATFVRRSEVLAAAGRSSDDSDDDETGSNAGSDAGFDVDTVIVSVGISGEEFVPYARMELRDTPVSVIAALQRRQQDDRDLAAVQHAVADTLGAERWPTVRLLLAFSGALV